VRPTCLRADKKLSTETNLREIIIYAMKLKNKSARSDWSYVYFTLMSPMIVYSATAKRQHFNCLGQVLRQNCLRHLQTFQIFISSATPAYVAQRAKVNSLCYSTCRHHLEFRPFAARSTGRTCVAYDSVNLITFLRSEETGVNCWLAN